MTERRPPRSVRPETIRVKIAGTKQTSALVMRKLGTIPEEEKVELPVFDELKG